VLVTKNQYLSVVQPQFLTEILFSLGETYRLLKKDAEAKSAYHKAIELSPRYKMGAFSPSRYYPEFRDW
jgi:tetratricopeptide (TPR) repeat protein